MVYKTGKRFYVGHFAVRSAFLKKIQPVFEMHRSRGPCASAGHSRRRLHGVASEAGIPPRSVPVFSVTAGSAGAVCPPAPSSSLPDALARCHRDPRTPGSANAQLWAALAPLGPGSVSVACNVLGRRGRRGGLGDAGGVATRSGRSRCSPAAH